MLRTILSVTFRTFFKDPVSSFITLSGLVVGMTTAILIFLWVSYELGFDRHHPDNGKIFAVLMNEVVDGAIETYEETPAPLAEYLTTAVPGVEAMTRIDNTQGLLGYETRSIQKHGVYADSGYFRVFNPAIVAGDLHHPLSDNHSIVISKGLAKLLFGNAGDALGKTVTFGVKNSFKVTGVFSEFPRNSSLRYIEFILPFDAKLRSGEEWQNYHVKLRDAGARDAVARQIDVKLREYFGNDRTKSMLFCLTDWRLHWNFENGEISGGRIVYVILFSITALFILIMAGINYVNITTAGAAKRAREIGVRKMTGATQGILVRQFMAESLMVTGIASLLSLIAAYLLLPLFDQLVGSALSFTLFDPLLLSGLCSIALFTGLLAGSYPAFLLSSFKPVAVLKGNTQALLSGAGLRKGLVVFQFTLSIVLIFSAVVMHQQTAYLLKKDLGYDRSNVINIWLQPEYNVSLEGFKTAIQSHASVVSAGFGGASPMEINGYAEVRWPGKQSTTAVMLNGASADHDMLPTLKLELVQGRNFSPEFPSDSSAFIITEKAAALLGFSNPVGETITYTMFGEQQGTIIGVLKDFHNENIHAPIDPVIFTFGTEKDLTNLFVRYREGGLDEALGHVKAVFNMFHPGVPLQYSFLDGDFEDQFYQERLLGNLSRAFTAIAVIIAGLGLFGLTVFNAQRRTREIGVRKVLGASRMQVMMLLCRDFFKPVLIAFILASPVAYYLMEQFLQGYAFRIATPVLAFFLVGIFMIVFVLFIVSFQSFQAATKNPVDTLKTD